MSDDEEIKLVPWSPQPSLPAPLSEESPVRPPMLRRVSSLEKDIASAESRLYQLERATGYDRFRITEIADFSIKGDPEQLRSVVDKLEQDLAALFERFKDAERPAKPQQIGVLCEYLVRGKVLGDRDPRYGEVLIEEVLERPPSIFAISRAVKRFIRSEAKSSSKWAPEVGDFLYEIQECETWLRNRKMELNYLAAPLEAERHKLKLHDRTPEEVERDERLERERKELAEERAIERCVSMLDKGEKEESGYPIVNRFYHGKVLREAERRIAEREAKMHEDCDIPFGDNGEARS
jgi:hypothetical protein